MQDEKPVFCVGIKFVMSNYKQNANNYFENMLGETANIQAVGELPYAQFIIFRRETPYYQKDIKTPVKIEIINDKDIVKYINLVFDRRHAHRPDYLGILFVDIDETKDTVSLCDIDKYFSEDTVVFLKDKLSIDFFFREIENYKKYLEIKNNG
jgi:hypothetical protein